MFQLTSLHSLKIVYGGTTRTRTEVQSGYWYFLEAHSSCTLHANKYSFKNWSSSWFDSNKNLISTKNCGYLLPEEGQRCLLSFKLQYTFFPECLQIIKDMEIRMP